MNWVSWLDIWLVNRGAVKPAESGVNLQPYMIIDAYIMSILKGPSIGNEDGKAVEKLAEKCQSVLKILE